MSEGADTMDFPAWYSAVAPRLARTVAALVPDRETAEDVVAEALARSLLKWDHLAMTSGTTESRPGDLNGLPWERQRTLCPGISGNTRA